MQNAALGKTEILILSGAICACILLCLCASPALAKNSTWTKLLNKYQDSETTKQLIFVKYKGKSRANVCVYTKKDGSWTKKLSCSAYTGKNGLDKKKEGDRKTPTGVYSIGTAFGIKPNPGAVLPYVKLNKYLYWCGDKKYYNSLVDIREKPHTCHGEHLLYCSPYYNYGFVINYNVKRKYRKGSGIFFHCKGPKKYTEGCVAVSQKKMVKILKLIDANAKICIYKK